jgi:PKHD-type hydroxylase
MPDVPLIYPFGAEPTGAQRVDSGEGKEPGYTLPTNDYINSPLKFAGVLSQDECARIIELGQSLVLESGEMVNPRQDYRKASISWIWRKPEHDWLFERIAALAQQVNRYYKFECAGFMDALQFTQYETGDAFDWHVDCGEGPSSTRKISISIQLSDPHDYDGGGLEFVTRGELPMARIQGTVIVFPSYICHRVTPITRGTRRALVAWASGPPFR